MGADDRKFSGPYKGVVVSNVDPYNYGRLLVRVEDVLGSDPCIWADPAPPLAVSVPRSSARTRAPGWCR